MEYRKLYRSRTNRVIAGVAEGLGEFFEIDPVIIRILFAVLTIVGGGGILIYVLLWLFVPYKDNREFTAANPVNEPEPQPINAETINDDKAKEWHEHHKCRGKGSIFGATILITMGVLFLLGEVFSFSFSKLWPILLIVVGILLLADVSHHKKIKN